MTRDMLLVASLFVSVAFALVPHDAGCCFHLTSYGGGPGGSVGQLTDGQNRIGQTDLITPQGQYCLTNGGLTDSQGRGCVFTDLPSQWQCDKGAAPTSGFAATCNGTLTHDGGDDTFFACPTGDHGGWNIYSKPVSGEPQCTPIWLHTDGCAPGCAPTPSYTPSPTPKDKCPTRLGDKFEFPHLIVPIDMQNPDKQAGTSFNGTVSKDIFSIFNFDIPVSAKGRTCSLQFLFPRLETLETSAYEFSGDGRVMISQLKGPASNMTCYKTAPDVSHQVDMITLSPGNGYDLDSFACPAGRTIAYGMYGLGNVTLNYFQDYNPCREFPPWSRYVFMLTEDTAAIGMYIVVS